MKLKKKDIIQPKLTRQTRDMDNKTEITLQKEKKIKPNFKSIKC